MFVDPYAPPFPLDAYKCNDSIPRDELLKAAFIAPKLYQGGGVNIRRVHRDLILKAGHEVRLSEAENMRFAAKYTSFPVPAVMDAWEDTSRDPSEDRPTGYILMAYIEGETLSDVWPAMETRNRELTYEVVVAYFSQLRSIDLEVPGPIGGDISRGTLFTEYGAGPFESADDLEAWFDE